MSIWNGRFNSDSVVGFIRNNGSGKNYLIITIDSKTYRAHHLAFIYMTGKAHRKNVDHINGNGLDNSWGNLRDNIDQSDNLKNMKLPSDNKSGVIGVFFDKGRSKWMAYINSRGKRRYLGRFKSKEMAIITRKKAELELGFHFNHGSVRPL